MDSDRDASIIIRPFRPEDQDAARALILKGLAERWGYLDLSLNPDLDDIAASYAQDTFLLAWRGEELVGTGALISEGEGVARIVRMSVARLWRRQGIGRTLLAHLLAQARRTGCHCVVLETTSTWQDAVGFYQSQGFRIVEHRDGDTHFVLDLD